MHDIVCKACTCIIMLSIPHAVQDVIPLLAESREVKIEQPLLRSKGQTVVLKTSHLCQWLESAASYYTITTPGL